MGPMGTAVFGAPEFRARSGRVVVLGEDGSLSIGHMRGYLSPEVVMDVEEFFQAKRDEELGRWRWPENPDWVAAESSIEDYGRTVVVVNERTLQRRHMSNGFLSLPDDAPVYRHAARAYFEAHPERKPWRDAKPGEGWAITLGGDERLATVEDSYFWIGSEAYAVRDVEITAGRRIWPEDAS